MLSPPATDRKRTTIHLSTSKASSPLNTERISIAKLKQNTLPEIRCDIIDSESKIASVNRVSINIAGSRNKHLNTMSIEEGSQFEKNLPILNEFIGTKLKFKIKRGLKESEADQHIQKFINRLENSEKVDRIIFSKKKEKPKLTFLKYGPFRNIQNPSDQM